VPQQWGHLIADDDDDVCRRAANREHVLGERVACVGGAGERDGERGAAAAAHRPRGRLRALLGRLRRRHDRALQVHHRAALQVLPANLIPPPCEIEPVIENAK
jgi:hypothetical protein